MQSTSASVRAALVGVFVLGIGLLSAQAALAQVAAVSQLVPVNDSGVSGTLTARSTGNDMATITVDAAGLGQGTNYAVTLRAGSCAMPSASFGALGNLQPDPGGKASLTTGTARASSSGTADLVFSDLTDGSHIIQLSTDQVVACGVIAKSSYSTPSRLPSTGSSSVDSLFRFMVAVGMFGLGFGLLLRRH